MPGGGTRTFLGPEPYEAGLHQSGIECILTCTAELNARLTWVELHHSQLFRCEEDRPRIGYLSLAPGWTCTSFPDNSGALPRWRGTEFKAGDILFHSRGDRLHQTTSGPSRWSLITFDPVELDIYARALFDTPLPAPEEGRVLRPSGRDAARLRRLHAQAGRLAETKPKILSHPEVARAIEQDLTFALATCLTQAKVIEQGTAHRRHSLVMVGLEEVLARNPGRPLHMAQLCELIGVKERTLQSCCAAFLGLGPTRYALRRRLKQVRIALRDGDADGTSIGELAQGYGFTQLGRFARAYRETFGESPSATLQRASKPRVAGQ